jgi:hypothetical protein
MHAEGGKRACRDAASLTAHSSAHCECAEPSTPTMIPGISASSFSLASLACIIAMPPCGTALSIPPTG